MAGEITPDMARAELARRRAAVQPATPAAETSVITPEMAREELARRKAIQADTAAPPKGRHLSFEEGQALLDEEEKAARANSAAGTAGAAGSSFLEDIPIVGPALLGGVQRAAAGLSSAITGEGYDEKLKEAQDITQRAQDANPVASVAGGVAGNIAALAPVAGTALGAQALGVTGRNLGTRALASGLSSGAISVADSAVRGDDLGKTIGNAELSAGIGAAVPVVGSAISGVTRAVGDKVGPIVKSVFNPDAEAARRVGTAIARDTAAHPTGVMTAADEAVAAANNVPVVNADRGGETTRALARSIANQSPEARAAIEKTANDRFGGQSQRAVDFVKRLTSGDADDIALQERVEAAARAVNRPAYKKAYESPEAQQMYSKRLQELMQSPSFRDAVEAVPQRSADRGAVEGYKQLGNPFQKNSKGDYVLRRDADGTLVAPTLQFWDHVKRNLDSDISKAYKAGDKVRGNELRDLKNAMVEDLDATVSSYKDARAGASAFFGAENAIEAGKKFANTPRSIPEAQRAFAKFSPQEKKGFEVGYASELIDKIKVSGDRTNVINSTFKNQAARESIDMVFGPEGTKRMEAYVRVEDLADRLRGAMGGSTTMRQFVEMGLGGLAGGLYTGDYTGVGMGALAAGAAGRGARYVGERVDAKVMEKVAQLLTTDNAGSLNRAVQLASKNPVYMTALERISERLAVPARAVAIQSGQ